MRAIAPVVAALALAVLAAPAAADEGTSGVIDEARAAYSAGDLAETSALLEAALAAVNAEILERLAAYLPSPPEGWTAADPEGIDEIAPEGGALSGLVVSRDYRTPGGSTLVVSIAPDSPLSGWIRMFVMNPSLASAAGHAGAAATTMCGFDAVEDLEGEGGVYEISILAGMRTVISVTGREEQDVPHIRALAAAIDCEGVTSVLE